MGKDATKKLMSEFAEDYNLDEIISLEALEEMMEQKAREEEADSIALYEEKRASTPHS